MNTEGQWRVTLVSSTIVRAPWMGQSPSHSCPQSSQTADEHNYHHHKLKIMTLNSLPHNNVLKINASRNVMKQNNLCGAKCQLVVYWTRHT